MSSRRLRCQGCVVTAQPNAFSGFGVGDAAVGQSNAIANGFDLLSAVAFPHVFQLDCWPRRYYFCLCIFVPQKSEFHGVNRSGLRLCVLRRRKKAARFRPILYSLAIVKAASTWYGFWSQALPWRGKGMMRVVGLCVGFCVMVEILSLIHI